MHDTTSRLRCHQSTHAGDNHVWLGETLRGARGGNPRSKEEAAFLLSYILSGGGIREAPTEEMCERYRNALRVHRINVEHSLHPAVYRFPFLLGFLDTLSRFRNPASTLQKKLLIAAAICECHPLSADWLLPRDRSFLRLLTRSIHLTLRIVLKAIGAVFLLLFPRFTKRNVA